MDEVKKISTWNFVSSFSFFFKQNTGIKIKVETLLTWSHNYNAIGLKQFHKKNHLW